MFHLLYYHPSLLNAAGESRRTFCFFRIFLRNIYVRAKAKAFVVLVGSVADPDPGFGIRCLFDPWIRDPGSGIGFFRISDPGYQNHIFESFVTIFCIKSSIIL
jgi:hypothetical protein